jgi:hypothetical protein
MTAFLVAGGTRLEGPAGRVTISAPSLVAYRSVRPDLAEIMNQTETPVTVRVAGVPAYETVRGAPVENDAVALGARTRAEFVRGRPPSVAEHEAAIRREKLAAEQTRLRQAREARELAYAALVERARAAALPAGYHVLIQAETPSGQEGGQISPTNRVGDYGGSFTMWNDRGHHLHYDVEVAHDGYYQIALKYCREGDAGERGLRVDGEYPEPFFAEIPFPGTGGWSRGADNWQLLTIREPLTGRPALVRLTAGRHRLTLENRTGDGGCNLDYIVVAEPFMEITRDAVEK